MFVHIFRFGILTILLISINGEDINIESSFKTVYNNYKQCEEEPEILTCLKLKALKLVDRALSISNIPITEGISLTKREDNQRSLEENIITPIDENNLPDDLQERNKKLDFLLWNKIKQFIETRSLQLRVNKLFFNENSKLDELQDGRGKKDKNKGMYMSMMMMKAGMMALAYKGLALLAGKALLVSKIALTLALIVAIKKLFSGGHHSQKTTYEIVKTPIIAHSSHQYAGGNTNNGHYSPEFSSYDAPYAARSLDLPEEISKRISLKPIETQNPSYLTRVIETVEGRSLSDSRNRGRGKSMNEFDISQHETESEAQMITENDLQKFNIPYAHLAAYRNQLINTKSQDDSRITQKPTDSSMTTISFQK